MGLRYLPRAKFFRKWAGWQFSKCMSQEDEIKKSLSLIQQAVLALDKKIQVQGERIAQLEKGGHAITQVQSEQAPIMFPENFSTDFLATSNKQSESEPAKVESSMAQNVERGSENTFEENVAGPLFMKIGITALVLGISFFLKYAFDNDWIGETGRILIGLLIGLGLLGIGEKTIRKYAMYGQAISGAGLAVLYLSIFSAFNYYHLIGSATAFFAMLVITLVGIALSFRYEAIPLMVIATAGAFAAPLLTANGQNNQLALFSYIVLLDLAVLAVAVFKNWRAVNVVGFIGTAILFSTWAAKFYTEQALGSTMFFLTIFFLLYSFSALIYNLIKKEASTGIEQALTLFSGFFYFGASYGLLQANYGFLVGFFALILAGYYFIWAFAVRNFTPEDENLYTFLAFLAVGFITLAIPVQFKQNTITISWAIEALLLMVIGAKLKKNSFVIFSVVVTVLTLFRYFFLDSFKYNQYSISVFNPVFLTAVILVGCVYLMAYAVRSFADEKAGFVNKKSLMTLFFILANFVSVFAISQEINTSYNREISSVSSLRNIRREKIPVAPLDKAGKNNNFYQTPEYKQEQEKIANLKSSNSIALSIFWLIYAVGLIAFGMVRASKRVRVGGMVLLSLAILKLFFVDLWSLGRLYQIISSMSLGVVLLLVSFGYQKYKDLVKKII
jgi:uncharacterized membrane protein